MVRSINGTVLLHEGPRASVSLGSVVVEYAKTKTISSRFVP